MDADRLSERNLAATTGIDREMLKVARESLEKGADWDLVKGMVVYTAAGIQRLMEALGVAGAITDAELDAIMAWLPPEPEEATKKTVSASFLRRFRSPHHIGALLDGREVTVRVRDSKNFRAGMEIPIREMTPGYFELARRCPRYRGRW